MISSVFGISLAPRICEIRDSTLPIKSNWLGEGLLVVPMAEFSRLYEYVK
jgi:hypothetical protein